MPTSEIDNVPAVVKEAVRMRPLSVLDLGVGFGKYGVLLREKLDIEPGRVRPEHWSVRIDGVEAFERYCNPIYTFVYNRPESGWKNIGISQNNGVNSGYRLLPKLCGKPGALVLHPTSE
jgi:hypothetical protein